MDANDKLTHLISEQKKITAGYEALMNQISMDKELNELDYLRNETDRLNSELNALELKYKAQVNDNLALKSSLKEQMLNEKIAILNGSRRKIQIYFDDLEKSKHNKLHNFERVAMGRINKVMRASDDLFSEKSAVLVGQLNQVEKNLQYLVSRQKEILREEKEDIFDELKREYDELKNETLDERLIAKKKKENDLEVKIGLDVINKIGMVLLLLGVATALRYSYTYWVGNEMKSILGFLFGGLMLGLGEWFNRKEKNVFALGLCGGGIGILYLVTFSSYFILNTLSLTTATAVSLLITIISIVFSKRYESQTITGLSLVGGYLPFFSYLIVGGLDVSGIYIAMAYLFVLNLTILTISLGKRWNATKWLSFILNMTTSTYLMASLGNDFVSIIYTLVIFVMYLIIILYKPIYEDMKLTVSEVTLLGLNTVINFISVYALFYSIGWEDYTGFLALVYGVAYYLLGQITSRTTTNLKLTSDIFYLTSITFAVLMIPLQFGIGWISLGWLVEAVLLLYLYQSKYKEEHKLERAGWIIYLLSIGSFIFLDTLYVSLSIFVFKYTIITLSLLFVLNLYIPDLRQGVNLDNMKKLSNLNLFKYFVVLFTWTYLIRISHITYENLIDPSLDYAYFFKPALFALVSAVYSYIISQIDVLKDRFMTTISTGLNALVIVASLGLTANGTVYMPNMVIRFFAIAVLLVYNVFIFFSIKTIVLNVIKNRRLSLEILPLSMAVYLLGSIPLFLLNQFDIANGNLVISLIFVVLSLVYIIYGFKEDFMMVRRFGLFLSMFATAKLFIYDLMYLSTLGKVVAYLSFGLTLIGISFIYQKLKENSENGIS